MSDALFTDTSKGATFSPCRTWRYRLWREWHPGPTFVVVGLNPSTADETQDDPTIRRCIGFAKRAECGRLEMLNLFAYRSTDPKLLYHITRPVGPGNDDTIMAIAGTANVVVAAWGAEKIAQPRAEHVLTMLADAGTTVLCFGVTAGGSPRHPLYLNADTPLVPLT